MKQIVAAIIASLAFASSSFAQEYWRHTPGSEWEHHNQICFIETNTVSAVRRGHLVMWEERRVCGGGGRPKKFSKTYPGVANCKDEKLWANDGYSVKFVSFRQASRTPHQWGVGNYGWGLACGATKKFN